MEQSVSGLSVAASGRIDVCDILSVLRTGRGALPSPGGEGAELARRKGSLGLGREVWLHVRRRGTCE